MNAVVKWLAGIIASIIAGLVVVYWTEPRPNYPPDLRPPDQQPPTPTAEVCSAAGAVYDSESNRPLAGVEVHYLRRTQDPNKWIHTVRSRLATTGPDGRFTADCASVEAENFPLRLELVSPRWQTQYQTNEFVRRGEKRVDVNLFVSDRFLRQKHF
jgi:hypothetical protein